MNKQTKIIIMGLLVVLLMGVLLGCPTEAPKEDDKKGNDGGPLPDFSISLTHIGSHEIVASTSVNININGEVTFVITDSETKPIIPAESATDGFITRTFENPQTRDVYMAQLGTDFPIGTSLGKVDDIKNLHTAFMKSDKKYYLHTFYTKQGDTNITHTSTAFTTTAHRTKGTFYAMVKNIEWKAGEENLNLIFDTGDPITSSITVRFPNGNTAAYCDPPAGMILIDCGGSDGFRGIFFANQSSLFIVNGATNVDPEKKEDWSITYALSGTTSFNVKKITD